MGSDKFPKTFWTRILINRQLCVVETDNLSSKLLFGKHPHANDSIDKITDGHSGAATVIVNGLTQAFSQKRSVYFTYVSEYAGGFEAQVIAHVQYCSDDMLCMYLTEHDQRDACSISQQNDSSLKERYDNLCNLNATVLNSLNVGVGIYDTSGKIVSANRMYSVLLGVSGLDATLDVENNPVFTDQVKEAICKGKAITCEVDYDFGEVVPKGHYNSLNIHHFILKGRPVENSTAPDGNYVMIVEDVTEKAHREAMISQNRIKTELAMEAADIVLWEFDVHEQIFYSENEPLNGYDNSKPVSLEQYLAVIHPDDHPMTQELITSVVSGEKLSFSIDVRMLLPGSTEWKYCTVTGSAYEKSPDGKVTRYVGIRKNNSDLQKRKILQDKILDNIPMSIHIQDVADDYRYIFCNKESQKLFRTSVNTTQYDVLDEENVNIIRRTDLEVFNTGVSYMGSERVVLKDGRTFDTVVRKSVIEDGDQRLLLSIRWDLSLENDLQHRSKLFALTLESMNAYTWLYEPDTQQLNYTYGVDKLGDRVLQINTLERYLAATHPDDIQSFRESLQSAVDHGSGVWRSEYRADMYGDGNYLWFEARGIMETTIINEVPHKYMYGMTISIDEHKNNELILVNNRERLNKLVRANELILNNTSSGLAYISTDYVVQWENVSKCSASLSFEAYKTGELCYKSAHNRNEPCENCVIQRAIQSHQLETIQFTLSNNRRLEVLATPVFDCDNVVEGVVIRVDDVTDHYRMIEELKHAKAEAEKSDKLKSAFLANMSHEIRTPLNAIVGFSDLLITDCADEDREEYIRIINSNNELLLKLIGDILDLSKIEAGFVDFKYEEFDMVTHFDGMLASMRQMVTNPNVRLLDVNPYERCMVKLDKNRVAQLMTNYVTNAIKYTPKGYIEMGYECVEGGIRLYVKDSGIGIHDDKKDRVFHRFAKLDEFAQGTGLGLSICKAIAESMGGRVGYESKYGEGSVFWVFLPCGPQVTRELPRVDKNKTTAAVTLQSPSSNTQNSQGMKTILVAEDIDSNYILLFSILKNRFNMLRANNGQEAIDCLRDTHVDMLLVDMKMPVMDGLLATAAIRKFNTTLPIVALTAHAFESDRLAALAAGCNDYLVKPIDKLRLMDVLQKYGLIEP